LLARGSFAAAGLDVPITVTPDSTTQMRGLGQGRWEIASTAFDNVLAWSGREGAEIIAIAQISSRNLLLLYARPEIKSWEDLRGKKLAADAVDTAYALVLRKILLAHSLDLDRGDYKLVAVGATGQRLDSMKRGETYAAILNPPWDAEAKASGIRQLADHREVLPDYPGGVLAVARSWAESHRDLVIGYLRAWLEALRWARDPANREEAIDLLAAEQKISRDRAADRLVQLPRDGAFNMAGLQSALDLRVELGLIPTLGPLLNHYTNLDYYLAASKT